MKDEWKRQRCGSCGIYSLGRERGRRNKAIIMNEEFGQTNTRTGGEHGCGIYRESFRNSLQVIFILPTDRKTKKNMVKWRNI
jgi:hypothetical protein